LSREEHDKWAYSIPGKLALNFIYYLGDFNTKFFTELRDNRKILGVKCPKCNAFTCHRDPYAEGVSVG